MTKASRFLASRSIVMTVYIVSCEIALQKIIYEIQVPQVPQISPKEVNFKELISSMF